MEAAAIPTPTFVNGEPIAAEQEDESTPGAIQGAVDDQLDDLEIQIGAREWQVAGQIELNNQRTRQVEMIDFERVYHQKPLSYTAMLQFTGLIGDRISAVMSQGVTLESMLSDAQTIIGAVETGMAGVTREDFAGVDAFVQGLAKLVGFMPSIVEECQCIWLRVPLHERPVVIEIWGRSPDDGGLSMQEGEEMLNLFIAQNYQELEDFFVERLRRIIRLTQATRRKKISRGAGGRQPLKPSNTIPPDMPSPSPS